MKLGLVLRRVCIETTTLVTLVGKLQMLPVSENDPVIALDQTSRLVQAQACLMRYFFHLEDGVCIRDPKGEEFPDDAAAMIEAAKVAQELSKLQIHAHEWQLVVKNADGVRVGSVPLVPSADDAQGVSIPLSSIH